jgi:hypothetical protein
VNASLFRISAGRTFIEGPKYEFLRNMNPDQGQIREEKVSVSGNLDEWH